MAVKMMWSLSLCVFMLVISCCFVATARADDSNTHLTNLQRGIVPIAAFTASGDSDKLKKAINDGLDNGLTINEIRDVLVQMYAYAGFPRSLTGLNSLLSILKEREQKGIHDIQGKSATALPKDTDIRKLGTSVQEKIVGHPVSGGVYDFAPAIDSYLKEHLFGDIFSSDILNLQDRELATVAALASLPAEPQLRSHLGFCMNVGLNEPKLREFVAILEAKVGKTEAERAKRLLDGVIQARSNKKNN